MALSLRNATVPKRWSKSSKIVLSLIIVLCAIGAALLYLAFVYTPPFACWGGCGHGEFLVITVTSCKTSGLELVCTLAVSNNGNTNVWATGCSIELGGISHNGVVGGQSDFAAGSSVTMTCTSPGTEPSLGSTANGTVVVNNGDVSNF